MKQQSIVMILLLSLAAAKAAPIPLTDPLITIQSLAVMGDIGHTQLVLRFPQKIFYRIAYDPMQNTLQLIFNHINSDSPLLPVDIDNTAIKRIHFDANDQHQFVITLILMPHTNVQSLRLLTQSDVDLVLDVGALAYLPNLQSVNNNAELVQPLIKILLPPSAETLVDQNYQQAQQLIRQQQIPTAINLLKTLLIQQPDFLPARISLAQLHLQQGQAQQALQVLLPYAQTTLSDEASYENYTASLAEAYRQTEQPLLALTLYHQLLNRNAQNAVWWVGLGLCLSALKQPLAAYQAYQKAQLLGNLPPILQQYVKTRMMK